MRWRRGSPAAWWHPCRVFTCDVCQVTVTNTVLCDAADPTEFGGVEQRVAAIRRQCLEQLLEWQAVLHSCELATVGRRAIVHVVGEREPPGTGQVLGNDGGIARQVTAEMPRKRPRIYVIAAAGRGSDQHRDLRLRHRRDGVADQDGEVDGNAQDPCEPPHRVARYGSSASRRP